MRVILFGLGFWGRRWLEVLQADPRCGVAAVVARTARTLNAMKSEFNLDASICFQDGKEALGTAKADVAVVAVPPADHLEVLINCLNAGLHLLCEKPITATWEEAVRIAAASKARPKQKFMIAQTRRWSDHIQALKRTLESGRIGKISFINVDHRVHNRHPGWRQELDHPVLEDMAVHHFDAIRFLTGEDAVSVYARSWNPGWSWYRGRACSSALFEMSGDIRVNYFGSWCTQGQQTAWEGKIQIVGENGSLDLVDKQTLHFYPADLQREPGTSPAPQVIPIEPLPRREIDYALNEFLAALAGDREPECSVTENLRTFAMACAAVESCRSGALVPLAGLLERLP